jgi:hypothetical protein
VPTISFLQIAAEPLSPLVANRQTPRLDCPSTPRTSRVTEPKEPNLHPASSYRLAKMRLEYASACSRLRLELARQTSTQGPSSTIAAIETKSPIAFSLEQRRLHERQGFC